MHRHALRLTRCIKNSSTLETVLQAAPAPRPLFQGRHSGLLIATLNNMTTISEMTFRNSVGAEGSSVSGGTASREPESTAEEMQGKVADKPYGANTTTASGTMGDVKNKQAAFDPDITDPKAEKEAMEMENDVSTFTCSLRIRY
ncbi:hypothetical protein BC937DRAFT_94200 [Endogone sp. FLAS-F59071]|nr:hypothetical protein BC937DRAFT_94200 [Endogone sp. FLAS-F59071]|eukprot:RUS20853.1 hypothetical protein BC937DRAFT_94200 [Endogone sp. FLAS-F59071]